MTDRTTYLCGMLPAAALLLLTLDGANCAPHDAGNGPSPSVAHSPSMAIVAFKVEDTDKIEACLASLVQPNFVVSAANCIKKWSSKDEKWVTLGFFTNKHNTVKIDVDEIHYHPSYDANKPGRYDIALVKMVSSADVTANPAHISCINLPSPDQAFIGWIGAYPTFDDGVLSEAERKIGSGCSASLTACDPHFGITPDIICVKPITNSLVGAPLVVRQKGVAYLAGVAATSLHCDSTINYTTDLARRPALFHNVTHTAHWIRGKMDELTPSG